MADVNLQARGIRPGLQLEFIKTADGRVTAATVADNIQAGRFRITRMAEFVPPALNTRNRKFGGIMALPHIHERFIGGDVVDSVGAALPMARRGKS